ncbi:hypothetical protein ANRL1_04325 [Anaerolineae bacterium]|nr:hypothetical protein ANRL1_04325 [Anaerolineae bacterium]
MNHPEPEFVKSAESTEEYHAPQLKVFGRIEDLTRGGTALQGGDLQSTPVDSPAKR